MICIARMMPYRTTSFPMVWMLLAALAVGCGTGDGAIDGEADTDAASSGSAASVGDQESDVSANPRFGVWQIETDRPEPYRNVMTYEPYGEGGMRITIRQTNEDGETDEWGYVTLFDGVFRPVHGREGAESAVEVIDERTNRILNARDGEVTQTIINVLSEDGNTIHNEYRSTRPDGTERISHAIYHRIG